MPPGPGMSSRGSEPSGLGEAPIAARSLQGTPAATIAAPWDSAGLAYVPPEAVDSAPLCPLHY